MGPTVHAIGVYDVVRKQCPDKMHFKRISVCLKENKINYTRDRNDTQLE